MDAADHQPEARPLRMRGHETEGRRALEHRLLGTADAADLEEMVHYPDRIEADLVGVLHDARERRPDRLRPTGPGERADLQADLHPAQGSALGNETCVGRDR